MDTAIFRPLSTLVLGSGSFAQGMLGRLSPDAGCTYAPDRRAIVGASLHGPVHGPDSDPNPCAIVDRHRIRLVVPESVNWARQPWADGLREQTCVACPNPSGMRLELDRAFAAQLCRERGIPVPAWYLAGTRGEAIAFVRAHPRAWVIKNPLCSPTSPIHTICCQAVDETLRELERVDDSQGIFLQEYVGPLECGHIALVRDGEIISIASNQEYKREADDNVGRLLDRPVGGLVERDFDDRHGLARTLLAPLRDWFAEVGYRGPVQVTAALWRVRWHVLEFNVRLGVTNGPLCLFLLDDPLEALIDVMQGRSPTIQPSSVAAAVSMTAVADGSDGSCGSWADPPSSPRHRVAWNTLAGAQCWWNQVVRDPDGALRVAGPRIADIVATGDSVEACTTRLADGAGALICEGSWRVRGDIGQSLWPPAVPS